MLAVAFGSTCGTLSISGDATMASMRTGLAEPGVSPVTAALRILDHELGAMTSWLANQDDPAEAGATTRHRGHRRRCRARVTTDAIKDMTRLPYADDASTDGSVTMTRAPPMGLSVTEMCPP
jgi:hypothetical protein